MPKFYIIEGKNKDIDLAKRYYFKAHSELKLGKWIKAIHYFKKSIRLKPDYYPAIRDIAEIYHQQGDLQEAQKNIKIALEINPNDPISLFMQGAIYLTRGLIKDALDYFERSRENGELTWGLAYNMGLCKYFLGDMESSVQLLNYSIQKDPSQIQPYLLLAQIFIDQNKVDMAHSILMKVKKIRPNDEQLNLMISDILNSKKL